jgi:hypothetical protein
LFLLNLIQGALQAELDRFFEVVNGASVGARVVTKAALTLARRKLHFGAFVEINRVILDSFYTEQRAHLWRGFRLLAIDGSTAWLPNSEEVRTWFGVMDEAQPNRCPMGRVSALYDVLNRIVVDAQLAPYRVGEHELALTHFEHLTPRDLVLFDRGYPAFWLFSLLRTLAIPFCMRTTTQFSPAVRQFADSGRTEQILDLKPGAVGRRECRKRGLSLEPIRLRLVRVLLETGEVEVLITSLLDTEAFPHCLFADLYHQRWGVEEGYKALKCRGEMENFTGKSVHSVMQDFHAKVVTTNLSALMAHQAQSELADTGRRHRVRVNFSYALARTKDTVVRLFTAVHPNRILNAFLDLLRRTVEPVRPGRSFPRNRRISLQRFRPPYKRCG